MSEETQETLPEELKPLLQMLANREELGAENIENAFEFILRGHATDIQIGAFLMALENRELPLQDLHHSLAVLQKHMISIKAPEGAIDVCGTGGSGLNTYNISTAVAFVLSGYGVPVTKHGNRAATSESGSADVLEELNLNLNLTPQQTETCIAKTNMGFLFAPTYHPALKHVAKARKDLGFSTIFNLLGPLCSPTNAPYRLMGISGGVDLINILSFLQVLKAENAWIVHGEDGMDEITTTTTSIIWKLVDGAPVQDKIHPEEYGISLADPKDLRGGSPKKNAKAMLDILQGEKNAYRDIVVLNAAAGLVISGHAPDIKDGVMMAQETLDNGKAYDSYISLRDFTQNYK